MGVSQQTTAVMRASYVVAAAAQLTVGACCEFMTVPAGLSSKGVVGEMIRDGAT
eukprot:COSAG02_NODE_22740_length_741_cov_1.605919_1_plen_54_part_00